MSEWIGDVVRFWFGLDPTQWWQPDPALDADIRERFLDLWTAKRQFPATSFLGDPRTALAAVLLFDQFPRHIFRGHADQFSTDDLALAVATGAVDAKSDDRLEPKERGFLYMPFQHSEDIAVQNRSIGLFTALDDENLLSYAKKHHDIVARFNRFPHRNAMLGRAPRPDETAAGDVFPW
ncbi:MAG: DUF924 family protein [Sphingomicrobium sp.]